MSPWSIPGMPVAGPVPTGGGERLEHVLGRASRAVEPVIEHEHPFVVIAPWFSGVIDDQRGVQSPVQLNPDVGW